MPSSFNSFSFLGFTLYSVCYKYISICVYVNIYIYIYIHKYIDIYIYINTHVYIYMSYMVTFKKLHI